jgi:hypothetical protein
LKTSPNKLPVSRSDVLESAPLHYAPQNELGVVYLFSHHAPRLGLRIDEIRAGFPDCIAYQKTERGEKLVRIEFEFRARNFLSHRHEAKECDWIVCWENDWPTAPKNLRIVELRQEYNLRRNVWIQPYGAEYFEEIGRMRREEGWTVPGRANKGDLLLLYFSSPRRCLSDVCVVDGPVIRKKARYRKGDDYFAPIRKVSRLASPLFFEDMRRDRVLSTAGFVRSQMRVRQNAREFWPNLYEHIIKRNSASRAALQRFRPEVF